MTEAEWLQANDPRPMLDFLRNRASDRKSRLFAVACCRRIWPSLGDDEARHAVMVAEAYADGLANDELRRTVRHAVSRRFFATPAQWAVHRVLSRKAVDSLATLPERFEYQYGVADAAVQTAGSWVAALLTAGKIRKAKAVMRFDQASFLRDIFANPFHPFQLDPSWLHWNAGTVEKLAQTIYDDRRFENLPILADALEEAGCAEAAILEHSRGPGPHVRGCWVVDLLLGKE